MNDEKKKILISELQQYMKDVRKGLNLKTKMEEFKKEMEKGEFYEGFKVPENWTYMNP